MNRQRILVSATVLLILLAIGQWLWSGHGLVTVDVSGKPLAEVIRSIEKQGGIVLKTNMDATKPVTMHLRKVPLTEALETLAEVTDSRWRVGYFFATDSAKLKGAFDSIASGKRPEGWKNFDVPLLGRPAGLGESAVPMDPRTDLWNVGEPGDKTLHGYLQDAAIGVAASFSCPEDFNPAVNSAPSSGPIREAAPKLAKIAGAKVEEVFLLLGRPAGLADADRPRDDDGEPGGFRRGGPDGPGGRGGPPNFDLFRQRRLAEIAKLPASEQPAAREEADAREKFFSSVRELPEEERRAKIEEYFNNPANQERMAERRMQSEERKTPEQRRERYQRYVQKKQQAMNSGKK